MDIELPGMDGVEALERLRADPATAGIPVMAVTASVMPVDQDRFAGAGFVGVIVKPIDVKAFPNQVLSHCNRLEEGG
jgi:two-component system, cell cycle response regulator DivK